MVRLRPQNASRSRLFALTHEDVDPLGKLRSTLLSLFPAYKMLTWDGKIGCGSYEPDSSCSIVEPRTKGPNRSPKDHYSCENVVEHSG